MSRERVTEMRAAMVPAIAEAVQSGNDEQAADALLAVAELVAGMIVRIAHGDHALMERLFLLLCEHTMLVIPELEKIRTRHDAAPETVN